MRDRISPPLYGLSKKSRNRAAAVLAGVVLLAGGGSAYNASATSGSAPELPEPTRVQLSKAEMRGGPPSDSYCYTWENGGYGCFEWDGDDIWVKDTVDNGHQFRVHAQTDYGRNEYCADDTAGWTQCNYNFAEDHCISYHGYHPPHARPSGHGNWTMGWSTSDMANCQFTGSH